MTNKPHLLMIDDNGGDVNLVRMALDEAHMDIVFDTASDGQHAQAILQRLVERGEPLPKVVLLDLNMPRIDGRQVLAWMRSLPVYRTLPVIIFTSSHDAKEQAQCLALGANDYWVKPSTFDDYLHMANRLGPFLSVN